ncbi:MAG: transglycosylase domain-containing protein [Candidatus Peregrinibacteria bacterium]|nr:transglycosylase domain-containing protein [Candidatus Peregrinibacteria bacterium]
MDLHKKIHDRYEAAIEKRGSDIYKSHATPWQRSKQPWNAKRVMAWLFTLAVAGVATGIFLLFAAVAILSIGLPSVDNISSQAARATEIYDRNGELLYTISGEENRKYVPYDQISPNLINATIAVEDDQFWQHKGFDMTGIAAAGLYEVFGIGKQRGGSTITQQYVKNAFLTSERSMTRKLRELIMAVRLEQKYDKKKILELYLNQIPYGNSAYGIQRAAEIYFGKNAADLTLAESAILAGIPQAPSYYNPYSTHKESIITKTFSPEELASRKLSSAEDINKNEYVYGLLGKTNIIDDQHKIYMPGRADVVLRRMLELGYITQAQKDAAWQGTQTISFLPFKYSIKAPHFVFYVKDILEQKYGKEILERGGLKVYTTLDWKLQQVAENAISSRAESNEKNYKATNAAALFADPKTGQILTMVGSRDYFNKDIDGNVNVTTRTRQPGSAFKPFVYAQAFLRRYTPATVLYDTPTKLGPDTPQNYDGTFQGPMSIRRALGQSRNIPAIKAYYLGGEQGAIIDLAEKMGITTLSRDHDYGYPLAIGAAEVKMTDMVTAFGTFANMGKRPELTPILKVEDHDGNVIDEWTPDSTKQWQDALDPEVSYLIDSILSDTSIKLSQNLTIPNHTVATKTGTSTNKTKSKGSAYPMDLWVMGYTPSIVGSVWVGNNRGDPLGANADGSNVSAPIWKDIMTAYLKDKPEEPFPRPEGIKEVTVSSATGLLPNENTPKENLRTEVFASFAIPTEIEKAFSKAKIDKRNDLLANDFCPPEMVEDRVFQSHSDPIDRKDWQDGVDQYYGSIKKKAETPADPADPNAPAAAIISESTGSAPTEASPLCTQEAQAKTPTVAIISPSAFSTIAGGTIDVAITYSAPAGIQDVTYIFDKLPRAVKSSKPFETATIKVPKFVKPGTVYDLKVKVTDKNQYSGYATIQVKIADANNPADNNPQASTWPIAPAGTTLIPSSPADLKLLFPKQ